MLLADFFVRGYFREILIKGFYSARRCRFRNKRWTGSLRACALKFSSSDRGLWDTSVSHCSLCLVFTLLHQDYSAACPAAMTDREEGGKRGSEVVGAPGREAFIKLALSLHRAIIAEWITSSHPGSHAALVPLSPSCVAPSSVLPSSAFSLFFISHATRALYFSPAFRFRYFMRPIPASRAADPSRHVFPWLVSLSLPSLAQFDASPIYSRDLGGWLPR